MQNIILVTMDGDSAQLPKPFKKRLCFSHCLSPAGALRRRIAMLEPANSIMGVSDLVALAQEAGGNVSRLCTDLVAEAEELGSPGVFLDFEQNYPLMQDFLAEADEALAQARIPLDVPERCARGLRYAIAVCEAAVSGGSFDRRVEDLLGCYGPRRVAAMLQPICAGFDLPSEGASGQELSLTELAELRARYRAQVYFSKELCAKYFTYMDERAQGHFILFDDRSTMQEKNRRLEALGITSFVLARDAPLFL